MVDGHDTLIAVAAPAGIDGHGDVARAEQRTLVPAPAAFRQRGIRLVEVRIAAQLAWWDEIRDQKIERAVGLGLQDQLTACSERAAEHGRQGERFP